MPLAPPYHLFLSEVCEKRSMHEWTYIYIYIIISSAVICPKIFWLLQVMVFPARSQCLDVSAFDYSVTLCFSESEFLKPHRKVTCMDFAKFLIACISAGNSTSHRSRIDACETQRHVEDWTQLEMFVFTREQLCFRWLYREEATRKTRPAYRGWFACKHAGEVHWDSLPNRQSAVAVP